MGDPSIEPPEQRFHELVSSIDAIVSEFDLRAGRFTYVSEPLERILGYPIEHFLHDDGFWLSRIHAEDLDRVRDVMRDAARAGADHSFDYRILAADDRIVWLRVHARVVAGPDGEAAFIRGVSVDVTALMQAEEEKESARLALHASEQRFRATLENVALIAVSLDAAGIVTFANDFLLELTGWTRDEVVGQSWFGRFDDDTEVERDYFECIERGEIKPHFESTITTRVGELRLIRWSSILERDDQGKATGIVTIGEDVTEQRELLEQLLHARKLEAVGQLAGGIAHDFNNLLTAIGGYTEFLLASFEEGDPRCDDALEIARATERAAGLTRQLLAFSRRQVLQPEVLDVGTVVAELENLLGSLLGSDVVLTTARAADCLVEVDRRQLERVITNLAVNARDAMPNGGRLSLATRRVEHEGGPYVELAVADTGTGMDSHTLAHLFEPFFTTKEKGKGTGLGLAMAYGIVAQSGGEVLVESEPGHGSTFRVLLPLATGASEVPADLEGRGGEAAGAETILLVEDEDTIRRLVRNVLARSGYTVLDAPAGDAALALLREHDVDLLLTDVVMPGMSGPDLARIAVGERPALRVLFTSGYTNEPEELLAEPDAAFIGKPFSPASLVAKVREVLDARLPA